MKKYSFKVQPQDSGLRLDMLLANFSKAKSLGLSRTFIKSLIHDGVVFVDQSKAVSAHRKVKEGEVVEFSFKEREAEHIEAEDIKLDIIYEDDSLAVINKPAGLVVHPAPGNYEHTLVNALKHAFKELSDINPGRPGIVHRLDKDTSGLLIIAKRNDAHLEISRQFSNHTIEKEYIAIVKGRMEFDEGLIEAPIARHIFKRKNMAVNFSDSARDAKTYYKTIKRYNDASLLSLKPLTGRTHQLRVHLDFIGHPILGDVKYGKNNKFIRLALHAKRIKFIHPNTGEPIELTAPTPEEFKIPLNKT
ncbi:MAG: RluA family pseudouridine synthase [Candidatus Omnitrophica bacterium]|nr:RluA family pseudouridine synthase [Candidatus Omnitrophota bacterium]